MSFTRVTLWTDDSVTVDGFSVLALAMLNCIRLARVGSVAAMVLTGGDETFFPMGN